MEEVGVGEVKDAAVQVLPPSVETCTTSGPFPPDPNFATVYSKTTLLYDDRSYTGEVSTDAVDVKLA